jgi:hypothetical protein
VVGPGEVSGFNRTNDLLSGEGQIAPLIRNKAPLASLSPLRSFAARECIEAKRSVTVFNNQAVGVVRTLGHVRLGGRGRALIAATISRRCSSNFKRPIAATGYSRKRLLSVSHARVAQWLEHRSPKQTDSFAISMLLARIQTNITKQASCSSTDQGGGKRRLFIAFRAAPARSGAAAGAWLQSPEPGAAAPVACRA